LIVGIKFNVTKAVGYSSSGTPVGGIILENTTWALENSPYIFVDEVTVAKEATLTIDPGVTLDLGIWRLIVKGTLCARGNETHRIKFQSFEQPLYDWTRIFFESGSTRWNETTGTGCIIEYAEIDCVTSAFAILSNGFPKISNNRIFNYGCAVGADGIFSNNTIMGGGGGILAHDGFFLYNIIKGVAHTGIEVTGMMPGPTHYPVVIGNLIMECNEGFLFEGPSSPYITNNTIVRNTYGFRFDQYSFFEGVMPVGIVYNNINSNDYDVLVQREDPRITINMTHNWWGTTNTSFVDQKIWDQKDNGRLCLVNYTPFLTDPAYFPLDVTPPRILNITQQPQQANVESLQNVTVMANITDDVTGVNEVILSYTVNDGLTWVNLTMNYNSASELYETAIRGQPVDTTVKYKTMACDYVGNYKIEDNSGQYYVYTVIPEFPSFLILPLFLIATLLAVIVYRRRISRSQNKSGFGTNF
jgi:hypothetical protein